MRRATAFVLTLALLLPAASLLAGQTHGPTAQEVDGKIIDAEKASHVAYFAIRSANSAGASVNGLTDGFNAGLELLRQSKNLREQGDLAGALVAASEAIQCFDALSREAQNLELEAAKARWFVVGATWSAVPLVAFFAGVASHFLLGWWRRRNLKRLLGMEIRERKEGED